MIKFIAALLTVFALTTAPVLAADVLSGVCAQAPTSPVCQDSTAQKSSGKNPVNNIVHVAADIVASLAGAVAIIMIIVSAFKFTTGGSNQQSVVEARNTLMWAAIGLVVVAMAWTIINFAINKLINN